MTEPAQISRRSFLVSAGGFFVAVNLPGFVSAESVEPSDGTMAPALGPFIHIPRSGPITFVAPSTEMGQGIFTAEAQLLAEELAVDLHQVRVVTAPPDEPVFKNLGLNAQENGGSWAVRGFYMPLRQAGASARYRLIAAAAKRWKVEAATCVAKDGTVVHPVSGRSLTYGVLADAAAREPAPPPEALQLTSPRNFRLIGHSPRRVDTPDKANGKAIFGIDVVRPGMKIAIMVSCPFIGGHLLSVDPEPAMNIPGVLRVLSLPDALVVVGEYTWAAMKGAAVLTPQWVGGDPDLTTESIAHELKDAGENGRPDFRNATGNPQEVLSHRHGRIDAVYEVPFLAHATMEPLNAVVEFNENGCEVWAGTQSPVRAQRMVCSVTGLPPEKVILHNQLMGGGFGRRSEADSISYAVQIAELAGVPIKMIWSREQDFRADMFRPAFRNIVQVRLGSDNEIQGWSHRIVGGDVLARHSPELKVPDFDAIDNAAEIPYEVDSMQVEYIRKDSPLPITFWRGVGPAHNVFVVESLIGELSEKAGIDPIEFRRKVLKKDTTLLGVLNLVAEKSEWGSPLPERRGRGVAIQNAYGSSLACVVDAEVTPDGDVVLHRVTAAVDCGQPVNPNGVVSQIEGGLIFGFSAALWGKIDVLNGQIVQSNFHDYRVMRINETPPIEVHIVPSTGAPQGIGEAGTAIAFAALAAAIHAATGVRLRSLPFDRHELLRKDTQSKSSDVMAIGGVAAAVGVAAVVATQLVRKSSRRNSPHSGDAV
jgi:isoquinoline 1-oxidoreductase subunit beta